MVNLTDLDLKLLQVFLAVVDSRGFATAQSSLNLGLSTISTHMASLEKRLGMRLCERGRGGFRLTPEGHKVYEVARSLVGTISDASSEFAALRNVLVGRLRIGIVDNVVNNAGSQIHTALNRFDSRRNEVNVSVEVISPRDLERHVADGLLDVGIGPAINHMGGIEYSELFTERQFLYCGDLHPNFAKERWALHDVAQQKYAGHICPLPDDQATHGMLHSVSTVHNMESVALLVLSGRFIGYLPEHYASEWVRANRMRAILKDEFHYDNLFYCMVRKRASPSRIVKQFRRDLRQAHPPLADGGVARRPALASA